MGSKFRSNCAAGVGNTDGDGILGEKSRGQKISIQYAEFRAEEPRTTRSNEFVTVVNFCQPNCVYVAVQPHDPSHQTVLRVSFSIIL